MNEQVKKNIMEYKQKYLQKLTRQKACLISE